MRYIKRFASLLVFCGFGAGLMAQQLPSGYEEGLKTITSNEILKNVTFLASDSLKGRAAGTDENDVAAMFIASKFKEYGLKTVFKDRFMLFKKDADEEEAALPKEAPIDITKPGLYDNYFQKFNIKKSKLSENNSLSLFTRFKGGSSEINYKYKSDFLVWYDGADNVKISAPVVFAGYGIAKGENGYNDFIGADGKEIDVKNKIVVVVDGFPRESDPESAFSKSKSAYYRNPLRKADVAMEKGAIAIIVITSPFKKEPPINFKYEKMASAFQKESFFIPELGRRHVPIIYVSKAFTKSLLKESGIKIDKLLSEIDKDLKPSAFEIKRKTVSYEINFDAKLLPTQNVIGFIEGNDPQLKNEYVVFGAHYDHVGLGYYGAMNAKNKGKIHPGADDNGSGTCGLIEIAEAFSKTKPRRSVVFIGFTGEENGLLGSNYYVHEQPAFPLNKTVAMLNVDMISRNEPNELSVCGAFYGKDIIKVVEESNKKIGFELFYNTGLLSNASDQGPFLKKNIPILFFFAGDHPDYHTPGDVVEKMDCEKAAKASKLAYLTGWTLATQDAKPVFAPLTQDEKVQVVKESLERQKKLRSKTK